MATSASASQGAQAAIAFKEGTGNVDFSTGASVFEFLSENFSETQNIVETNGIRGTRAHSEESSRGGLKNVQGTVNMVTSAFQLNVLLPWFLGTDEATDVFAVAETLQEFGMLIDKVGAVYEYRDCQIGRVVFQGSPGNMITSAYDIVAKTQNSDDSFPSTAIDTTLANDPYMFHDCTFDADGETSIAIESFTLTIDNALDVKFRNSQTASDISSRDRIITLDVVAPYNSTNDTGLYNGADAAATLTWTNSTVSTTWNFTWATLTRVTPVVSGKNEIALNLSYMIHDTGASGAEVSVTNDAAV